jgi:hypothetical protein
MESGAAATTGDTGRGADREEQAATKAVARRAEARRGIGPRYSGTGSYAKPALTLVRAISRFPNPLPTRHRKAIA